jgi:hypothetical protein
VKYEPEWTLELFTIVASPSKRSISFGAYKNRNFCVQMQRSETGNYRAVLVDLGEFRGDGSTEGLAVDDLIHELEHVAAEIRRTTSHEAMVARRLSR